MILRKKTLLTIIKKNADYEENVNKNIKIPIFVLY